MRTGIDALAEAMRAKVTRDPSGDRIIAGRMGNIHEDGTGYSIAVLDTSSTGRTKRWGNVKRALAFCQLRQDGDGEGCLHLSRLPTRTEATLIRKAIVAKKRREYSPEALLFKQATMLNARRSLTRKGLGGTRTMISAQRHPQAG